LITSSDCEGAGEVFSVATAPVKQPSSKSLADQGSDAGAFFRSAKYLTVSSQLHLEALAQSVGNVWTLSPTFRAERSDTPRHLSEFYMLEAEAAFVDDLAPIMDVVEQLLRNIAQHLMDSKVGKELLSARSSQGEPEGSPDITCDELHARWIGLVHSPWPRITYSEAIEILQSAVSNERVVFDFSPKFGIGLQAEHEKHLARVVGQGSPVFVTDYPRDVKPFYMAPSKSSSSAQESSTTVACFDLLVPEVCEIVGGSLREHRLPQLLESMQRHDLLQPGLLQDVAQDLSSDIVPPNLQWYVDLRRFGSVPHGGFGLGFDRLLCYLSGVSNIREVVAFPRWHGRCDC
jgi:asparaginyl-tRNA synthetase